ncbi:hypothetical protein [Acidomonas methanolica]|nr:hypothetical protein [Acidomonas methanolica]
MSTAGMSVRSADRLGSGGDCVDTGPGARSAAQALPPVLVV